MVLLRDRIKLNKVLELSDFCRRASLL